MGDGSIPPPVWDRPLIPIIGRSRRTTGVPPVIEKKKLPNTFWLFLQLDVVLLLLYNGTVNAVFYAISTTITPLFQANYAYLSETDIGLCFLALGGGLTIGSYSNGKLLDYQYKWMKKRFESRIEGDPEKSESVREAREEDFR